MIILMYRKLHMKFFPWTQHCSTAKDALDFIDKLGEDYDVVPFMQVTISDLYDQESIEEEARE